MFVRIPGDVGDNALPVCLLIGGALTAAGFAVLTRVGVVDGAIWVVSALSAGTLIVRWSVTRRMIGDLGAEYALSFKESRLLRVLAIPVAALLWLYAIAPPRDGDVMRYHLAHIRQIVSDGGWQSIADYHYALPFGWTLNYLPFERLGLPQVAGLVNSGLWVLLLGGLMRAARGLTPPATDRVAAVAMDGAKVPAGFSSLICLAFLVHPFVLRTFSSAMADGYGVFVVFTIAFLLLKLSSIASPVLREPAQPGAADVQTWRGGAHLGFVCWIGAQSRYQLVAAGIAGSLVLALLAFRARSWRLLLHFTGGAIAAMVLSAPFYLANVTTFGNPVWPLLVPSINGTEAYANRIATDYTATLTGPHDPATMMLRVAELVTTPALFPFAILLIAIVLLSLRAREQRSRHLALFGALFLCLWAAMQPRLYPRNIVLLVSLGPLLLVSMIAQRPLRNNVRRIVYKGVAAATVVMVGVSAVVSRDYIAYDLTGNSSEFHRFTWYYPVFAWVNHNTPRTSRFLVITYSGHSYYLDRPYRRGDPWLSGVVDWPQVNSVQKLKSVLDRGGYDYVIYDDRDWSHFDGGVTMAHSIRSAVARGILEPVHVSKERLYTSRIGRVFSVSNVYVLKVARKAAPPVAARASHSAPHSAL